MVLESRGEKFIFFLVIDNYLSNKDDIIVIKCNMNETYNCVW